MTVWREVQEALYERFLTAWVGGDGKQRTPVQLDNETFSPPDAPWVLLNPQRRPGGQGTLGSPGNRKMDRAGVLFILLRVPPGDGVGELSDLAEDAAKIFENCRLPVHGVRFNEVEPGTAGDVDGGRYRGVAVEARFDYEEIV